MAIGLGCYATYLAVRAAVVNRRGRERARRNAEQIVALERRLGIHVEPEVQAPLLVPRRNRVLGVLNAAYVTLNVVVTVGVLFRLFLVRDPAYHQARRSIVLGVLAAQPVFLFLPTEPPRKQEHLVDTIHAVNGVDLDSGPIVKLFNPISAMPSIHMVFAVCSSAAVLASSESPVARGLAWAYPPGVAFTVVSTANHYVLDIVAGTALAAVAVVLSR